MTWNIEELLSIPKGQARRNYAFKFRPIGQKFEASRLNIEKGTVEKLTVSDVPKEKQTEYRERVTEQIEFVKKYNSLYKELTKIRR